MEGSTAVKEIRRNTAACETCQERKRKCDGKAPCAFCVSKKIECKFSQQKKRGPSKKRRMMEAAEAESMNAITTVAAVREAELFDKVEAQRYLTMYFRFDYSNVVSASNIEGLLSASTAAHKVQLYAALADAAQSCGDFVKGRSYINQARLFSGSIYDSLDGDSVKGLMMMRKYWYHTLDFSQCTHYSGIAWSLAKLVKGNLESKIKMYCQFSAAMSDFSTTLEEKLIFLKGMIAKTQRATGPSESRLFHFYLDFAADFLEFFGFNIFYPNEESVTTIFKDLNGVHIDEKIRLRMLESANNIQIEISHLSGDECTSIVLLNRVFCPMYQMLINWKSGHLAEAMANALNCISAFDALRALNAALTSTNLLALVVGYTHICMLGSMIQFLMEQGQTKLAERVESHITAVCKTRGPEYNTIEAFMEEYKKSGFTLPPSTGTKAIALPTSARIVPLTPEHEQTPSPTTSTPPTPITPASTPPTITPSAQEDLDAQIQSLRARMHENADAAARGGAGDARFALDIDISKPLTPQLLEQLRAINLTASLGSHYENDVLKVNSAMSVQKVDPNLFPAVVNKPKPSQISNTYSNTNMHCYDNLIPNKGQNPDIQNISQNTDMLNNVQNNIQNNVQHNVQNHLLNYMNYHIYPNSNTQIPTFPHSNYQLHPSLQHPTQQGYHTTYQLPSHPSYPSHPSHSHSSQPLPHETHSRQSSHTSSHPPHPSSTPSHSPQPATLFSNEPTPYPSTTLSPNSSRSFSPVNPSSPGFLQANAIFENFLVNTGNPITLPGNPETTPDNVLSILDQYLCPGGGNEGYMYNLTQDSEMSERAPQGNY